MDEHWYILFWKESQETVNISGESGVLENFTFHFVLFHTINIFLINFITLFKVNKSLNIKIMKHFIFPCNISLKTKPNFLLKI